MTVTLNPARVRAVLAFVTAVGSACAFAADRFEWTAPLALEGRGGVYVAEATAGLYAGAARADLADLRVRNGAGEIVPHALRLSASSSPAEPQRLPVPIFPLWAPAGVEAGGLSVRIEQKPGGAIVGVEGAQRSRSRPRLAGYVVDASAFKGRIDALHLEWDGTGFAGRVRVETSDDLDRWTLRTADAAVMALAHDGQTLAARRVALPGTEARYLRISWPAAQETPAFRGVRIEPAAERAERPRTWQRLDATTGEGGRLLLDAGARAPVDRVRIELPMNAVLPVEIHSRNDRGEPWRLAAATTLYRLERAGAVIARDEAAFTARNDRFWMIRPDPRAGLAPGALQASLGYVPHEIVFVARGDPPFALLFGDAFAESTALPLATLVPGHRDGDTLEAGRASIGAPARTAVTPSRWPAWLAVEQLDAKRLALWAVLGIGVAALGALAWRLARQVS
jgi:hypothetical protein